MSEIGAIYLIWKKVLIRFHPGYGDTVNKAMEILSFICFSGNQNGENKTGMAVSVTAMFISQYAGKNYS
ncbi:hypothetical protein ACLB1R_00400 [Escherichia coli]